MRDFFADAVDNWTDDSGQIHAYLIPGPGFLAHARSLRAALRPLRFLGVQPEEALHVTVGRLPVFAREARRVEDLTRRLGVCLQGVGPVQVAWAGTTVAESSVVVAGSSPAWESLTGAVGRAAGEDGVRPGYTPPARPHVTLAYGVDDGPDADVREALGPDLTPFDPDTFRRLDLCAVHQNPRRGVYTFETVHTLLLG